MPKRLFQLLITLISLVVLAVGGIYLHLRTNGMEFSVEEARLQSEIAKAFPVEMEYGNGITLIFFDPRLIWQDGERLEFAMRAIADVKPMEKRFSGSARLSGVLRFRRATGEFFIEESRMEEIDISGIPMVFMLPLRGVADAMVQEHLNREPIYQLEGPIRGAGWLAILPGIEVRDAVIQDRTLRIRIGI